MKNIALIILLISATILSSCKKDEVIPDTFECSVDTEIWRSDNYKKYHGIDSVKFELCLYGDSIPVQIVYSNSAGIAKVQLKKNTQYTLRSISRTYNNSGGAPYHYSSTDNFVSSIPSKNGNIIHDSIIIYYTSSNAGIGTTSVVIQDPCYN